MGTKRTAMGTAVSPEIVYPVNSDGVCYVYGTLPKAASSAEQLTVAKVICLKQPNMFCKVKFVYNWERLCIDPDNLHKPMVWKLSGVTRKKDFWEFNLTACPTLDNSVCNARYPVLRIDGSNIELFWSPQKSYSSLIRIRNNSTRVPVV